MKMKNKKITLIVLCAVLLAVVLLYFFVIAPLMDEDDPERPTLETGEGEGNYYGYLMMYPEIDTSDLISISITNSHGTFSFSNKISEDTGTKQLTLTNYPRLKLSQNALSNLRVYTLNTQCKTNEPLRDCTPEQMALYGVTEDTCQASYTVKFMENGVEKEHTVYIGDRTLSSSGSYFATVKGRNVIYEIGSGLESALMIAREDFVDPLICAVYSEAQVVFEIQRLMIGNSNESSPFIGINATRDTEGEEISVKYSVQFPTNAKNVTANTTYISNALNNLLVNFTAQKIVEIDPSEETCAKYGLGKDDVTRVVSLRTFDLTEYRYTISKRTESEEGSFYYILIPAKSSKDVSLIARLDATTYDFLESENAIKWVATNSVDAGFTKYIQANEQAGESGVADITIMSNTNALSGFSDKFILNYAPHPTDSSKRDVLTVTSESGRYTFTDDLSATDSERKNQFNNFYAILVNYPMPNRFNTMTDEERASAKTEQSLILSIRITMNDGTKMGYDYYKLDSANVMCEFFDDVITEPTVVFDTTLQHVNILATALDQLISGEQVEKH